MLHEIVKNGIFIKSVPDFLADWGREAAKVEQVLSKLETQFVRKGGEVSISDFYGMYAANVDIRYVIFCDIMKIWCDETSLFAELKNIRKNPSTNIDSLLIANAFREYARVRDCTCSTVVQKQIVKKN